MWASLEQNVDMTAPATAARRFAPRLAAARYWLLFACLLAAGCGEAGSSIGKLDLVWGRRGISDGRLQKPRAMAIDDEDNLYIVDMTARIQVFTADGEFIRSWQTPVHENGRPTGLSIDARGRVLVADTHYFRVLIYSPVGELLEQIGGTEGPGPGDATPQGAAAVRTGRCTGRCRCGPR